MPRRNCHLSVQTAFLQFEWGACGMSVVSACWPRQIESIRHSLIHSLVISDSESSFLRCETSFESALTYDCVAKIQVRVLTCSFELTLCETAVRHGR